VIVVKEMNVVGPKQQFFQRFLRTGYYGEHSIFWLKSCSIATLVGGADRYFLAAGNCHAQTALACSICNNRPRRADYSSYLRGQWTAGREKGCGGVRDVQVRLHATVQKLSSVNNQSEIGLKFN